jgi:hypothetical protein
MKRKFFYMLVIICCMSFLSDAKQVNTKHTIDVFKCPGKQKQKVDQETGFDSSPIRFLIFTI